MSSEPMTDERLAHIRTVCKNSILNTAVGGYLGECLDEIDRLRKEQDIDKAIINRLRTEDRRLREALTEIAKGEGLFSMDRLQHATNTVESMKALALDALGETMDKVV